MRIRAILFFACVMTFFACAPKAPTKLYPGNILPKTQIAVVNVDRGTSVTFYKIVDRGGYQMPNPIGSTEGADVELLPGFYKAMVTYISDRTEYRYDRKKKRNIKTTFTTVSTEPGYVEFTLKAGGVYSLKIKQKKHGTWRAELIDPTSGTVVSKPTSIWKISS